MDDRSSRWATWRLGCIGVSAVLLVVAAALLAAAVADATWTEVPVWLQAFGTIAAFGAAVVAALLVARTVKIELDRERERLNARKREQAAHVAVWPTSVTREPSAGSRSTAAISGVRVQARNASVVPVTNVHVLVMVSILTGDQHVAASGRKTIELLLPDDVSTTSASAHLVKLKQPIGPPPGSDPKDVSIQHRVEISFTDAAGVRWARDSLGSLREVAT